MIISADVIPRGFISKLLLSCSISALLLALLIKFTLSSAEPAVWSSLLTTLGSVSGSFILLYIIASLVRTVLQALRYRLLLGTSEETVPSLFHILLVTLSRNMFVDMLPARLGELSYIAMLNRGYRVRGQSCVSSLAISFVFDLIALGILIALLAGAQLLGGALENWMIGVLIVLAVVIATLLALLYPMLGAVNCLARRLSWMQRGFLGKVRSFLEDIEKALLDTRRAGVTNRVLALSVGIRAAKYFGLYCLFAGVVATQFPEMTTRITTVLAALVSAEAGASLPVPAFMGFGTYEAGGTLALVALGASRGTSLIVMLSMHIISQIIDYILGAIGVILFLFRTPAVNGSREVLNTRRRWPAWILVGGLLGGAALFLLLELRAVQKRGAIRPPDQGQAVATADLSGRDILQQLDGFMVWSSNRSGNHDIYLYSLPDGNLRQLTTHPHSEYFPRISPDGKRVVFARSHEPWVSQRNMYAWGVWLLDIESGREELLAKNGTMPTWSADGMHVYFLRHGNEVVELNVREKRERILFKSGASVQVSPKTALETPSISQGGGRLAVTLRNTMRGTAVVEKDGGVRATGNGCQLIWGPKDRYLYKVDHGGKMENAIFRIDPQTLQAEKWFDAPAPFSHEYFPKVANSGNVLVYGASGGGHEHDTADYEIFLWPIGQPASSAVRISHHTGNDCWPDVYLYN